MTLELEIIVLDEEVLQDIDNVDDFVMDEMTATMRRAVDVVESAIVQFTPVGATGQLRQAWGTTVRRGISMVRGKISNPLNYAIVVEKGRRPGKMPPIAPIELWVRRKLQIAPPESRQVAFLVARKIGREGTEGQMMAERGLEAVRGIVQADFRGVPARVVRRVG